MVISPRHGRALWRSDGTASGTSIVDIHDIVGGFFTEFVNVNGTLFFSADAGSHGRELWSYQVDP